jgi:hypothetical protein
MMLFWMAAILALGWLLAVGIETDQGWRPPFHWWGWRDVHPFWRSAFVLAATWLAHGLLTENGRPVGAWYGIAIGLALLQTLLAIVAGVQLLLWAMRAHAAHALLRATGLTDREIVALRQVNEHSPFGELVPALSGFQKLSQRIAAVQATLAVSGAEQRADDTEAAASRSDAVAQIYTISDLVRYYVLSDNGEAPGVWQDCYRALCSAYDVPPNWEKDQVARMRSNECRDQEMRPEQRAYNLSYADCRIAFERARQKPMGQLVGPGEEELDQSVYRLLMNTISSLDAPLRELDRAFFRGVYGSPVALTLDEARLVAQYNFPDAKAQAEYWAASL